MFINLIQVLLWPRNGVRYTEMVVSSGLTVQEEGGDITVRFKKSLNFKYFRYETSDNILKKGPYKDGYRFIQFPIFVSWLPRYPHKIAGSDIKEIDDSITEEKCERLTGCFELGFVSRLFMYA